MDMPANDDAGKLILRLAVGLTVLSYGIAKLLGGVSFIEGALSAAGIPGFLAFGVYLGEVVGPLLLIAGFYARIGAALVAINMVVAILLVHASQILSLNAQGGIQLDLQILMLFGALASMLLGPGRMGVNTR